MNDVGECDLVLHTETFNKSHSTGTPAPTFYKEESKEQNSIQFKWLQHFHLSEIQNTVSFFIVVIKFAASLLERFMSPSI